jgi:hypothetical protein
MYLILNPYIKAPSLPLSLNIFETPSISSHSKLFLQASKQAKQRKKKDTALIPSTLSPQNQIQIQYRVGKKLQNHVPEL